MSFDLHAPQLEGARVRLEPLGRRHVADLTLAVRDDRTTYGFTTVPEEGRVEEFVDGHLARASDGLVLPYAQVERVSGRAVGITTYCTPRLRPDGVVLAAVEIGYTWLAPSAQGTGLNTEAKYLLFRNAFEEWGVARVDLRTDARNARSRAAIEKVGARFEGVLRSSSPSRVAGEEGLMRDSAVFSVIAAEWPECRAALERRLGGGVGVGKP
ncbi:GNAT family protein [Streptomyces sp. NPDC001941]|uniref:GNAT family N-acetyltransferase n=1 Tax=Streptomyces sp. NPDC001941 TaxID=3154659 RepID=UPI0033337D92